MQQPTLEQQIELLKAELEDTQKRATNAMLNLLTLTGHQWCELNYWKTHNAAPPADLTFTKEDILSGLVNIGFDKELLEDFIND